MGDQNLDELVESLQFEMLSDHRLKSLDQEAKLAHRYFTEKKNLGKMTKQQKECFNHILNLLNDIKV